MKRFIFAVVMMVCATVFAANPAFSDFTLTQFGTNGNKIVVKSGASLTNLSEVGQLGVNNSVNGAATPAMILRNLDPTAVTLHATGEFIQMADTGSNVRNAAYFKVQKEQEWTTTASTRDAKYVIGLAKDGNLVDQVGISSGGNLTLMQSGGGIVFPDATVQTTAATGGGGSQTPWTSDINGAGFNLTNVTQILGTNSLFNLNPTAADGNPIASFDSSALHTTGDLITFGNLGTNASRISPFGGYFAGQSVQAYWNPDNRDSFSSFWDTTKGQAAENYVTVGVTSNAVSSTASYLFIASGSDGTSSGSANNYDEIVGRLHNNDVKFVLHADDIATRFYLRPDQAIRMLLEPSIGAGSVPYFYDTTLVHTNGLIQQIQNFGTNIFTVDFSGAIKLAGTTNQITFGGTNTPPVSAVAPTKWISVQVQGEAAVYRVPLYE